MMQAHKSSRSSVVVMDIATFKVSHATYVDIHATTLQAKNRARDVPLGRWNVTCVGSACKHSAMEESSKMQDHPSTSGVVMDIAADKVSHSVRAD